MRFAIALGCGACRSHFTTVVDGEPCPHGGDHAHIPLSGVVEQWGASHHQPGVVVIGPVPEES